MNFLTRLLKSITDFKFYQEFQKESIGKAFLYLIKLTIIFGTVSMVNPMLLFDRGIDQAQVFFQEKIPYFVFENGELNVSGEQPFIWEDEAKDLILVMDTSGRVGPEILADYREGFYITKDHAVYKPNGIEKREFDFSQLKEAKFTKDDVAAWIPNLKWFGILLVIFGLIAFLIGKIWSALWIAVLGLLICSGNYRFAELYKLSVYALTLPIIIKSLNALLWIAVPWFGLIYYGIASFYIWKAIESCNRNPANFR